MFPLYNNKYKKNRKKDKGKRDVSPDKKPGPRELQKKKESIVADVIGNRFYHYY